VNNLNELEMYKGVLLANIFLDNNIVAINYETGEVIEKLDFSDLIKEMESIEGYN